MLRLPVFPGCICLSDAVWPQCCVCLCSLAVYVHLMQCDLNVVFACVPWLYMFIWCSVTAMLCLPVFPGCICLSPAVWPQCCVCLCSLAVYVYLMQCDLNVVFACVPWLYMFIWCSVTSMLCLPVFPGCICLSDAVWPQCCVCLCSLAVYVYLLQCDLNVVFFCVPWLYMFIWCSVTSMLCFSVFPDCICLSDAVWPQCCVFLCSLAVYVYLMQCDLNVVFVCVPWLYMFISCSVTSMLCLPVFPGCICLSPAVWPQRCVCLCSLTVYVYLMQCDLNVVFVCVPWLYMFIWCSVTSMLCLSVFQAASYLAPFPQSWTVLNHAGHPSSHPQRTRPGKHNHSNYQYYLIISWYLCVWNRVAVAAYSRLASQSQVKFQTMKLSSLSAPCAAAPAQSTVSTCRSLGFCRATSSQWGWWLGSWPLLLRSIHEDTS